MTRVQSMFDRDVRQAERDLPADFKFGGKTFTGSTTEKDSALTLEDNGVAQNNDFQLVVRKSAFGSSAPMEEQDVFEMLKPAWGRMRVNKLAVSQDGLVFTYTVVNNNDVATQPE